MYSNAQTKGMSKRAKSDFITDPQTLIAQELMKSGGSTAPVQSGIEGLTRALTGVVGGYEQKMLRDKYTNADREAATAMASALSKPNIESGIPAWINPDTGKEAISAVSPGYDTAIANLKSDPAYGRNSYIQEQAQELMGEKLKGSLSLQNDIEKAQALFPYELEKARAMGGLKALQPPSGYERTNDGALKPIAGGPDDPRAPKKLTPDQAAKVSMAQNALEATQKAKGMLFDANGKIDTKKLLSANLNIPGSEGRQIRNLMKTAIEAQLRTESGAAVPAYEVDRALDRFMPSPLDNDTTKAQKIQQLENLLTGTLSNSGLPPQVAPNAFTQRNANTKPKQMNVKVVGNKSYVQDSNGDWYEQ